MASCSFFGHRKIEITDDLERELFKKIENLIVNDKADRFLFGSRSDFDSLCHEIVTELREQYPNIKRVAYNTKSEYSILEQDREKTEKSWSRMLHREVRLKGYEERITPDIVYKSGKASYIERNQEMVNESDICLFYYDKSYAPEIRQLSNRYHLQTSSRSGTALIYEYAVRKKKKVINIFDEMQK